MDNSYSAVSKQFGGPIRGNFKVEILTHLDGKRGIRFVQNGTNVMYFIESEAVDFIKFLQDNFRG